MHVTGEKFYVFDFVYGDVALLDIFKNIKSDFELKELPAEKANSINKSL